MTKAKPAEWGNFKPANDTIPLRLIWRSYGPEKTGKNHFGYTAAGPIAVQSFDIGLEGVVEKFLHGSGVPRRDIRVVEYEFDKENCSQDAAVVLRDQFVEDFETALRRARTIQWDTETEVWELFRFAEFGAASDAPKNYVELNTRYRDLIQQAYDADVSLQLIQKVKERWISVKEPDRNGVARMRPHNTGEMEPVGFKEAGYIVQANLQHSWTKERGFIVKVLNCRQNMGIAGDEFENVDFPTLAQLVFPESHEDDWQ